MCLWICCCCFLPFWYLAWWTVNLSMFSWTWTWIKRPTTTIFKEITSSHTNNYYYCQPVCPAEHKTDFKMVSRQSVSNQALALFLALFCIGARAAQASIDDQSLMSSVRPTPFPVCIDDSDCLKLGEGNKYACFQVGSFKLSTNQRSASTYLFLHLPISVPTYFSTYLFQYLPISVDICFNTYIFQYPPI